MIKLIKSEADHTAALERIEALMNAPAGTPEADELELLAFLVAAYEEKAFPIEQPSPQEAIKFRMEQLGIDRKTLASCLGGNNRVSEVLAGKRNLSLAMIRNLNSKLGIPAEVLLSHGPKGA